jgi:hypothetical protein
LAPSKGQNKIKNTIKHSSRSKINQKMVNFFANLSNKISSALTESMRSGKYFEHFGKFYLSSKRFQGMNQGTGGGGGVVFMIKKRRKKSRASIPLRST